MRKRVLMVVTMCVLSLVIGVTRKGVVLRTPPAHAQAVAAAEKSDSKEKGPAMHAGAKKLLSYLIKYG
jgi:hypothetical protein